MVFQGWRDTLNIRLMLICFNIDITFFYVVIGRMVEAAKG